MALDKVTLDRLNQDIENAKDLIAYNLAVAAKQAYLLSQEAEAKKGQVSTSKYAEFEVENDDEPTSSYVESTDADKQESKQNNADQLTSSERAFVEQAAKEIKEVCEEHDAEVIKLLDPPVSAEATDVLKGETNIHDVDEKYMPSFIANMNLLRPRPTPAVTATEENELELATAPSSRPEPTATAAQLVRADREQRTMMAFAMLGQALTENKLQIMNELFDKLENNVFNKLEQGLSQHSINTDRKSLVLTALLANLASSGPAVTNTNKLIAPYLELHNKVGYGLGQKGSNLPKPQFTGGAAKELDPSQLQLPPMHPSKTFKKG